MVASHARECYHEQGGPQPDRLNADRYLPLKKPAVLKVVFPVIAVGLTLALINWHGDSLAHGAKASSIVVDKSERVLLLYDGDVLLKSYTVSFGANPIGHKEREGDERTPEGHFLIDRRNPTSSFHKALHISYPSEGDILTAKEADVSPGGQIMIHGIRNGIGWIGKAHRLVNWTDGCIAVTNREMDEIWRAVDDGTPIVIRP